MHMTVAEPSSRPEGRLIEVVHQTAYQYQRPVEQSWQLAHLQPRSIDRQTVRSHRIEIDPVPDWIESGWDYFGNAETRFAIHAAHRTLTVTTTSLVEVHSEHSSPMGCSRLSDVQQRLDRAQFTSPSPQVPGSRRAQLYASRSFRNGQPFLESIQGLSHRIHRDFQFDPNATTVTTPLEVVIAKRSGVCQDFAHLMIACLREVGVPARYVSGYIVTEPPPGQLRLIGVDASHAWVSACSPEGVWVDIDPTNDRLIDTDFVTLAWGRDFSDVTPLRGVILGGGEQTLEVRVTVTPMGTSTG